MLLNLIFMARVLVGSLLLLAAAAKATTANGPTKSLVGLEALLGVSVGVGAFLQLALPVSVALSAIFGARQILRRHSRGCDCFGRASAHDPWLYSLGRTLILAGAAVFTTLRLSDAQAASLDAVTGLAERPAHLGAGDALVLSLSAVALALALAGAGAVAAAIYRTNVGRVTLRSET